MNPLAVELWTHDASGVVAGVFNQPIFIDNSGATPKAYPQFYPVTQTTGARIRNTFGDDLNNLTRAIPAAFAQFAPFMDCILIAADDAGANYVNLREGADNADAVAVQASGRLLVASRETLFNGATWDRFRSASAANMSAQPITGVAIVTGPGNWILTANPGASLQATATRAAGAAGVRHILTSIVASVFSAGTASVFDNMTIVVRDGASGVGTILWQDVLTLKPLNVAGAGSIVDHLRISGLNIVGSPATAMTVEFTAAPGIATDSQIFSATGFDAT